MAKDNTLPATMTDAERYAQATAGVVDLPEDAIITSSGDALGTWSNARPGFRYYLLDEVTKDRSLARWESEFKPAGWVPAAHVGMGDVHVPRESATSLVITISEEKYQRNVWSKRVANLRKYNEVFGIGEPGKENKRTGVTIHGNVPGTESLTM